MKKVTTFLAMCVFLSSGLTQAALIDRGNGLIYDNVLNITWLQDANYARTSGYDADGTMTWEASLVWADQLVFSGYSDWRLPTTNPINGSDFDYHSRDDGTSDRGHNISAPGTIYAGSINSEMAYMFYNNLGNNGFHDINGANSSVWGLQNTGLFTNLTAYYYWSGTAYTPTPTNFGPNIGDAWAFYFHRGRQDYEVHSLEAYAWAVRDGDVATPIPEPKTYIMLIVGLGLMGVILHRRKHKKN